MNANEVKVRTISIEDLIEMLSLSAEQEERLRAVATENIFIEKT